MSSQLMPAEMSTFWLKAEGFGAEKGPVTRPSTVAWATPAPRAIVAKAAIRAIADVRMTSLLRRVDFNLLVDEMPRASRGKLRAALRDGRSVHEPEAHRTARV